MVQQFILLCLIKVVIAKTNHCDGTSSSGACIMHCNDTGSCSGQTLNCMNAHTCSIHCNAFQSCSNLTVNANTVTDITVICSAQNACTHSIDIECGARDCRLLCDGKETCSGLKYTVSPLSPSFKCFGDCPQPLSSAYIASESDIRSTTNNQQNQRVDYGDALVTMLLSITSIIIICSWFMLQVKVLNNKHIQQRLLLQSNVRKYVPSSPARSLFPIMEEGTADRVEIDMNDLLETNEWSDYCTKSGEIKDANGVEQRNEIRRFLIWDHVANLRRDGILL